MNSFLDLSLVGYVSNIPRQRQFVIYLPCFLLHLFLYSLLLPYVRTKLIYYFSSLVLSLLSHLIPFPALPFSPLPFSSIPFIFSLLYPSLLSSSFLFPSVPFSSILLIFSSFLAIFSQTEKDNLASLPPTTAPHNPNTAICVKLVSVLQLPDSGFADKNAENISHSDRTGIFLICKVCTISFHIFSLFLLPSLNFYITEILKKTDITREIMLPFVLYLH